MPQLIYFAVDLQLRCNFASNTCSRVLSIRVTTRRAAGCEATSRVVLCHKLRLFVLLHNIPLEVYCFAPLSKTHRLEQHRHIFVLNVFIWAKNLADCFHLQSTEKRELCNQDI